MWGTWCDCASLFAWLSVCVVASVDVDVDVPMRVLMAYIVYSVFILYFIFPLNPEHKLSIK